MTLFGQKARAYGTCLMRLTKVTQICAWTGNPCAAQLSLGHTKTASAVRNLGVELENALAIAESIEIQEIVRSLLTAKSGSKVSIAYEPKADLRFTETKVRFVPHCRRWSGSRRMPAVRDDVAKTHTFLSPAQTTVLGP